MCIASYIAKEFQRKKRKTHKPIMHVYIQLSTYFLWFACIHSDMVQSHQAEAQLLQHGTTT